MKRSLSLGVVALLMLPITAVRAEDAPASPQAPSTYETLIAAKSPSIVSLKMVLAVTGTMRGQSIEQEINHTATGVVVDKAGLVMVASAGLNPLPAQIRRQLKVTPSNIRVIYPGDEKEYDAILGAKDSKLGLGFVLIKDLADREAAPVDLETGTKPSIGQKLYGVTRMNQSFDHAPMCDVATVTGQLTKPRKVWLLSRAANFRAKPLYTADGAVAGIVVDQKGVGEGAGTQVCLLPLGVAKSTIARSLKAAQEALEEANEAEAEAAAAAKEEADAAAKEGDAKKDGEEKQPDATEPAPKDEPKKDEPKKEAPKSDEPKKDDGV